MASPRITRHPSAIRRGIGLIRVSKERDGMTSPEVQRHAIQAHAERNGIHITEWVEGIDESGSRRKSAWWPRLEEAIRQVEARDADVIVVWKFSRIARSRIRWATAVDRVDVAGGTIESATEANDPTPAGDLQRGMLGELNLYQAALIGEGWKETHARRLREGKPATGRPRFGYIRENDTYTPDPATAPVVVELYHRAVAGHGMATLARWLNDTGHHTRDGNAWQTIGVTRYLDRGFAAGYLWVGGDLHPGAHEALIEPALWEAYQARRAGTVRPPRGSVRMLSGLLKCGTCHGPMMAVRASGENGSYGCAARARGGTCTAPASIERHIAEGVLSEWVAELPTRVDRLREADAKERRQRLATIEDRAAIGRRIQKIEQRLARLTNMLLDEAISRDAYEATAAPLNTDLASLRQRHKAAAPRPESNLHETVPSLVAGWAEHDPAAQNRIARALVDRIIVDRGRDRGRVHIIPLWERTRN